MSPDLAKASHDARERFSYGTLLVALQLSTGPFIIPRAFLHREYYALS